MPKYPVIIHTINDLEREIERNQLRTTVAHGRAAKFDRYRRLIL